MTTLTYDADGTIRQDGQAPDEWLKELFEYEVCAECGWDADHHIVILSPVGNFFAMCLDPFPDSETDPDVKAELEQIGYKLKVYRPELSALGVNR